MYPAFALLASLLRRTLQQMCILLQFAKSSFTLLFTIVGILYWNTPLLAQKTSDKTIMEQERRKLQRELRQIQQTYDAVKGQRKNNLHQLAALNKKIELQQQYINNIGKEVRLINDDIYYSAIEIKRLKEQVDTLKARYAKTIVYTYKNRSNYDYLNFIFSASSFNDAVKRVAYLKNYRNYCEKQMSDIVKTNQLIDKRYAQQLSIKKRKENALETRTNEYAILGAQRSEKDSVAKLLQSQAGSLQKQIAKKQKEDKQLQSNITAVVRKEIAEAKKIAQAEAQKQAAEDAKKQQEQWSRERLLENEKALAAAKPTTITKPSASTTPTENEKQAPSRQLNFNPVGVGKTTTVRAVPHSNSAITASTNPIVTKKNAPPPPKVENKVPAGGYLNYQVNDVALNSDFSQNRGKLPPPVDGVITLGFGRYKIEGLGPNIVGDNPGVTYTAQAGAPVRAVFGGEVVSISRVGTTSFVVLRHGKYFTAYSNLATVIVSKGASVARGQSIGTVGTDEETGSGKLDFILMIEEKNVDPRTWLR